MRFCSVHLYELLLGNLDELETTARLLLCALVRVASAEIHNSSMRMF